MAHRTFTDTNGIEWQVWDVNPHVLEEDRRSGRDRRVLPPRMRHPERRTAAERRARNERRTRPRLVVCRGLENGWLTFESAGEKRRLIPIPAGWQALSDEELDLLRIRAVRVRARRR